MPRTIILDGTGGQTQETGLVTEVQEQLTTEVELESAAFNSVTSLDDVNLADLENDSVLMYKASSKKWVATKHFESHSFEAGQY